MKLALSLGIGASHRRGIVAGPVTLAVRTIPVAPTPVFDGGPTTDSGNHAGNVGDLFEVSDTRQTVEWTFSGSGGFAIGIASNASGSESVRLNVESDTLLRYYRGSTGFTTVGSAFTVPSVAAGASYNLSLEPGGDIVLKRNGVEINRMAAATAAAGFPSIGTGTKVYWYGTSGGTITTLKASAYYVPVAPLTLVSHSYNQDTRVWQGVIEYYSNAAPTYEAQRNGGAWADVTVVQTDRPGHAVLQIANADTGMNGWAIGTLRQKGTSTTAAFTYAIPEPIRFGVNSTGGELSDVWLNIRWQTTANYNDDIGFPFALVQGGTIPASLDGLGGTVRRTRDNTLYGNSLGIANYRALWNPQIGSDGVGNYTFQATPGTPLYSQNLANVTNFAYNQTTGVGSFTIPAEGNTTMEIIVPVATLTANGIKLSAKKASNAGEFDTATLDAMNGIAGVVRFLDPAGVNAQGYFAAKTWLNMEPRTLSNCALYGYTPAKQVEICNQRGWRIYYQHGHVDDDAYVTAAADALAQIATHPVYYALSNEVWNYSFGHKVDCIVMALRLGMGPVGATPGTLVPETIYQASIGGMYGIPANIERGKFVSSVWTPVGSWDGSGTHYKLLSALPNDAKLFQNPHCFLMSGANPVGRTWPIDGGDGVTIHYDAAACERANMRWLSHRTKQIITIMEARFTAAGKPRPVPILEVQAASGFSGVNGAQNPLDWGNLWQNFSAAGGYVAAGFYYGNGINSGMIGVYGDTTYPEWTPSTGKGALYDTVARPVLADRINAAKDAYFSASRKAINGTLAAAATFRDGLVAYNLGKGLAANAIKMCQYEFNHHVIFEGGWPNTTDSGALFESIILDSRHGADLKAHAQGLRAIHGGPTMWYNMFGYYISQTNYYGLARTAGDIALTGVNTNYRYKTGVEMKAYNAP